MASKVYIDREFSCQASELYKWLTTPQLIARWFGPKGFGIGSTGTDLQVGGDYHIEMIKPEGNRFFVRGQYELIEPPSRLVFSLYYDGTESAPPPSRVMINIEDLSPSSCRLSLIHAFDILPEDIDKRTEAWKYMMGRLAELTA